MACVTREALISALVLRAKKGELVSRADIEPLLRSGGLVEQLVAAFAGEGEGLSHARTVLSQLVAQRG